MGDLVAIKKKIVDVIKILDGEGLFEMSTGHVSARIPGSDRICILGHVHHDGRTLSEVTVDDIVTIDLDGKLIEGRTEAPGEKFIHTEIYKRRPDVMAVVHNHPKLATAFSVAGQEILPVSHRGAFFTPKVPILKYAGQIDSPQTGSMVAETLGSGYAVLLQGHGAVTVGHSLEEVCIVSIALEVTADSQLHATILGQPHLVSTYVEDGIIKGLDIDEVLSIAWPYYSSRHLK